MAFDLPAPPTREPVECLVKVRGVSIGDLHRYLIEARVEVTRATGSAATLTFDALRDELGRYPVLDDGTFEDFAPITIEAAFGARTEPVLEGYIRSVRASYPQEMSDARVTVECRDASFALDREHVRKVWGADAPTTDDAIVREILVSKHRLRLDAQSGPGLRGLVLPQDATDIAFLRARARANGYELIFRGNTVYFGPMRLSAQRQPTIFVYAGLDTSCVDFQVTSDAHWPTKVAFDLASTTDTDVRRREVAPALRRLGDAPADPQGAGLRDYTWLLSREGASDEDELTALAQGRADELSMRIRAKGEIDGALYQHVLAVGAPVGVDGVGDRLGGTYYVDRVEHLFTSDGYRENIALLRNAYGGGLGASSGSTLSRIL